MDDEKDAGLGPEKKIHISQVAVREYRDGNEAKNAASSAAVETGGRAFPCTLFDQGGRKFAVTAVPMQTLGGLLQARPALKGEDPSHKANRPIIADHVKVIRDYILDNHDDYVLPPFSVTFTEKVPIYTVDSGKTRGGYLVIPEGTAAQITDGQHRYFALIGYKAKSKSVEGALSVRPELLKDAIGVQITIEDDIRRQHQDFADMAQTKTLPKSLLTVYDLRDPVNRLVSDVIENSRLLRGRVDGTQKTLSRGSRRICLSNWIRNTVKGAIAPDYFVADAGVGKYAREGLPNDAETSRLLAELLLLFDAMAGEIPELAEIASIDPESPEANKVPEIRDALLITTAVGFGISGMVLRVIRTEEPELERREELISRLYRDVKWWRRKDSKKEPPRYIDEVWLKGGILADGRSVRSNRSNIFVSTARIIQRLGLPVPERMMRQVERYEKKAEEAAEPAPVVG